VCTISKRGVFQTAIGYFSQTPARWSGKLVDEFAEALVIILSDPANGRFQHYFGDRPNPNLSRISGVLSFDEAELLAELTGALTVLNLDTNTLLYDGSWVVVKNFLDVVRLRFGTEKYNNRFQDECFEFKIKHVPQHILETPVLSQSVIKQDCARIAECDGALFRGHCFLTALMAIDSELGSSFGCDVTQPVSVHDANEAFLEMCEPDDSEVWQFVHVAAAAVVDRVGTGAMLGPHVSFYVSSLGTMPTTAIYLAIRVPMPPFPTLFPRRLGVLLAMFQLYVYVFKCGSALSLPPCKNFLSHGGPLPD
jgi:hypothetical protein